MVSFCLLAVIYFATIFFAGVHVWSRSIIVISILACVLAGLVWQKWGQRPFLPSKQERPNVPNRSKKGAVPIFTIIFDPLSLMGIFFVALVAIQVIPIPHLILRVISPNSSSLWEATGILGGDFPSVISLYPFMTVNSLIFAGAVLLFYWLALYGIESRKQIQRIILGLLILGLFESLYGLFQLVTGEPYILWWKKAYYVDVATGTFINRNHLAGFLSMLICLGVGYIWALGREERRIFRKRSWYDRIERWGRAFGAQGIIIFLCIAVMGAGLLGSASRGGMVSLFVGLIFMVGLISARFFKNRNVFVLISLLSVVGMYVGYVAADRVLGRFHYIESGFESRMALTKETLEMGENFPLSGTGLGTFEFVYPGYQKEVNQKVVYGHNDWAQLFAETGWVGLCIVLAGLVTFLVLCIIQWRKRHDSFSIGVGLGGMGALVAISVHSISDFNLHMPANELTLALIGAVTYLSLFSKRHHGEESFEYPKREVNVSRWAGVALILVVALGSGVIGNKVISTWRADSLARIFWNSTIPCEDPTDQQLKKAWQLAPGNARYWAWMAGRVFAHPEKKSELLEGVTVDVKDPDISLWSEGIKKNPTAWWIWRELGWGAFAKQQKDPEYYLPLAVKALERASKLRPYSSQGYREAGTVALAWKNRDSALFPWREAFKKALELDPALAPKVTDQLVLYLGAEGAYEIKGLLPDESSSYLMAAGYLLKEGYPGPGIDILKAGELKKGEEVGRLLEEYKKSGMWSRKKGREILGEILSRDPQNPAALMLKGNLLKALQSQERRGNGLESLNSLKDTVWKLRELEATKRGSPVEIAYFLGRIDEKEGNIQEAEEKYHKVLRLNPQYFPAWIHLRDVLAKNFRTAGDRVLLERLEKKIQLFSMDRIVADAWKWAGNYGGLPSWKAPFRVSGPVADIDISFTGDREGAWKLLLDGRFVESWAGGTWKESRVVTIPAGEHELLLVYYGNVFSWEKEKPPFMLQVQFKK